MQCEEQATVKVTQATTQFQEPLLVYDPQTDHWRGTNEQFSVWMDNATFLQYVAVWVALPRWQPDRLPEERHAAAVAHCRRLQYWWRCERNYDRNVHIRYH